MNNNIDMSYVCARRDNMCHSNDEIIPIPHVHIMIFSICIFVTILAIASSHTNVYYSNCTIVQFDNRFYA